MKRREFKWKSTKSQNLASRLFGILWHKSISLTFLDKKVKAFCHLMEWKNRFFYFFIKRKNKKVIFKTWHFFCMKPLIFLSLNLNIQLQFILHVNYQNKPIISALGWSWYICHKLWNIKHKSHLSNKSQHGINTEREKINFDKIDRGICFPKINLCWVEKSNFLHCLRRSVLLKVLITYDIMGC